MTESRLARAKAKLKMAVKTIGIMQRIKSKGQPLSPDQMSRFRRCGPGRSELRDLSTESSAIGLILWTTSSDSCTLHHFIFLVFAGCKR